ncbi:MAG: PD40 domain-containing protein [Ignavibacteriales bacterium]|nr:PD40 domain-containing protein [Ignavibacteriales bacterium]
MLASQEIDFPHTELEWFTIATEHFLVHYHQGVERTAKEVAWIAEEIFGPITTMYQHRPDQRVSIVIRDHDDYSNGAAYFYDNKIEIWAPSLDFEMRGTHPWLLNVVTHEFTHIVQIQTAMKLGRRFPAVYFQWLGYEAERRPDVLYGYPNVIVSYPLSAFVVPSWFAEGVAQYNHPDLKHDYWDSHRDMILRMYMLEGNLLSWEEMAVFGKTSLGNESAYNAGFSITEFIATKYGSGKLSEISEALGSPLRLTIDGAVEHVLGKTGEKIYNEWKEEKERAYRIVAAKVENNLCQGEIIEPEGFGNFYPQFSPDGLQLAYVSNKARDYFTQSGVYLFDTKTRETKKILDNVRSTLSFSPDGRFLYYSKSTRENPHWSKFYDIYRYDLVEENERRLTHGWRAMNPKLSEAGSRIVFVVGSDGTLNIATADKDGKDYSKITRFKDGEQVFTPVFSPDGKKIAFGFSTGHKQSLALINEDGSDFRILRSESDCRNPEFSRDGKKLFYSSDRTGIFNLYSLDLESRQSVQVTNVLGGAFLATVDVKGNLAYASYSHTGYKIAKMSVMGIPEIVGSTSQDHSDLSGNGHARHPLSFLPDKDPSSNTSTPAQFESKPYKNVFSSLSLIPFVRFDNYNPRNSGIDNLKPGLYFTSFDMLDKLSLFGGGAINRNFERDLFLIFEFRDRLPFFSDVAWEPTLGLELYNITRTTDNAIELPPHPNPIGIDVTYNLFELDVVLKQKVFSENNDLRLTYALSRYSADIGSFVNPNSGQVNPAFKNVYLIGNTFSAFLKHDGLLQAVDREINPMGRSISVRYSYELNKFNPNSDYTVVNGILVPVYTDFNFQRWEFTWNEHMPFIFEKHTFSIALRGGGILGPGVDNFFDFYAGGFAGMRGYPFYAIGGNEMATAHISYRFPVSSSLDFRILQFYFKKLYASIFADIGSAWTGEMPTVSQWKKDAGFELRLETFSFYAYPTRFFFSGAYGFDKFSRKINVVDVAYGKEWRFYLGVLFGFEISELGKMSMR